MFAQILDKLHMDHLGHFPKKHQIHQKQTSNFIKTNIKHIKTSIKHIKTSIKHIKPENL